MSAEWGPGKYRDVKLLFKRLISADLGSQSCRGWGDAFGDGGRAGELISG